MDGEQFQSAEDGEPCAPKDMNIPGKVCNSISDQPTEIVGGAASNSCLDTLERQLHHLVLRQTETDARLEHLERLLAASESKLRSCEDLMELIGLLRDRIKLIQEAGNGGMLPGGVSSSSGDLAADESGPGLSLWSPTSPMRSTKSPIGSPKSPRSH
ncbi:uncharacterized protein LOC110979408 isoform X1 [Acanthaster planci]|uniref:Uncharacterized protein LOC110979408 isoform X1 n=1 Tax=Acanthaster planci TaxID=133434 RepID=A0A8B7YC98_ACAPL|nr:uncharacterized protein LOC110979408 isoform X1 [Acanthaster planci]